jgi:hypothetical protein
MVFALLVAWVCVRLLRFAEPFRRLFPDTCIYVPDDEARTIRLVLLFALAAATLCFVTLLRRHPWLKRFAVRFLIGLIAFGFGVLSA